MCVAANLVTMEGQLLSEEARSDEVEGGKGEEWDEGERKEEGKEEGRWRGLGQSGIE